ncbi:hypothetical protein Purlil1_1258 [Purpureocillium lilacinum]|uniref:Uncharacterized protein n=1 Tax=Purpureocillium lilacinum TaxID=33203 RepID=A0ABR0CFX9_PURLI|nr:hypothetical protein Purlil1_1258 [Purpureocillium lilacinum]
MEPFCLLSCPVSRPHQIPETSTAATLREVRIGSRSRSRRSHIEQVRTSPSGPWQAWKNSLTSPQDPSCPRRARRDSEAALTRRSLRLASCHVHLVLVLAVAPRDRSPGALGSEAGAKQQAQPCLPRLPRHPQHSSLAGCGSWGALVVESECGRAHRAKHHRQESLSRARPQAPPPGPTWWPPTAGFGPLLSSLIVAAAWWDVQPVRANPSLTPLPRWATRMAWHGSLAPRRSQSAASSSRPFVE